MPCWLKKAAQRSRLPAPSSLFLLHGGALILPPSTMRASFAADFVNLPPGSQTLIGGAELLAGLRLILAGITKIAPWLTPLAATGLVPIMLGAIVVHARRGEVGPAVFNGVTTLLIALRLCQNLNDPRSCTKSHEEKLVIRVALCVFVDSYFFCNRLMAYLRWRVLPLG